MQQLSCFLPLEGLPTAMKRGFGVGPDPLKGQNQDQTSKGANGEAGEKGTFEAPAKPRSNTVATFLRPQLSPGNTSDSHRQRSSTAGHGPTTPARVLERRNALVRNTTGFSTADIHEIRPMHKASDGGVVDSGTSRSTRTPWHTENSFSVIPQTGHSSKPSDRSTGTGIQDTTGMATGVARDCPPASVTRGTASANGQHSSNSLTLESHAAQRFCQSSSREIFKRNGSDYPSQTGRSTAISARQTRSLQEATANRRALSAYCQNQKKPSSTATAGLGKAREAENGRVGFTAPCDKVPTSYFLSATRTRESLLVPGEGRAYHLGVQRGELHNRILTVGHAGRADWLAEKFLDPQMRTLSLKSNRNFRLHSGYYRRKPVSIVAVGTGAPMMDVLVREASYITDGPLAIVRLGTCTLLDQEMRPGSIVIASPGSLGCYTNYAYFDGTAVEYSRTQELKPYIITRPCAADPELSRLIYRHAASHDAGSVFEGLNASAETFYSCQAREDQLFRDENEDLLETLLRCGAQTMEMETHQLLHLASRRMELMKAAAVHIGVTSRTNDHFMHPITPSQLNELVAIAGRACLDALVDVTI